MIHSPSRYTHGRATAERATHIFLQAFYLYVRRETRRRENATCARILYTYRHVSGRRLDVQIVLYHILYATLLCSCASTQRFDAVEDVPYVACANKIFKDITNEEASRILAPLSADSPSRFIRLAVNFPSDFNTFNYKRVRYVHNGRSR